MPTRSLLCLFWAIWCPRSGSSQVGSDCSRVAQHALVLGSSQHVCSDSSLPSKRGEPADPTVQSVSPQRSPRAQPPRLAPLAYRHKDSLMKWQRELRLLKDNQPEPSMSRSGPYLSNGASHTRWTSGHLL